MHVQTASYYYGALTMAHAYLDKADKLQYASVISQLEWPLLC